MTEQGRGDVAGADEAALLRGVLALETGVGGEAAGALRRAQAKAQGGPRLVDLRQLRDLRDERQRARVGVPVEERVVDLSRHALADSVARGGGVEGGDRRLERQAYLRSRDRLMVGTGARAVRGRSLTPAVRAHGEKAREGRTRELRR